MGLKRAERYLKIAMGAFTGGFFGTSLYRWYDWNSHPEVYAAYSAPFHVYILPSAAMTAAVVALAGLALALVRRRRRQMEDRK